MSLYLPDEAPRPGFFLNYKHDPAGPLGNHTFEVLSMGFDTEATDPDDVVTVLYRPLSVEAPVFTLGLQTGVPCLDIKKLRYWRSVVSYQGRLVPRFVRVTDDALELKLREQAKRMYP